MERTKEQQEEETRVQKGPLGETNTQKASESLMGTNGGERCHVRRRSQGQALGDLHSVGQFGPRPGDSEEPGKVLRKEEA